MSTTCTKCGDSGATFNRYIYDCQAPGCTAAVDRSRLEAVMRMQEGKVGKMDPQDAAWWAYQVGRATALEQAAKMAEHEIRPLYEHPDDWDVGYEAAASTLAENIRSLIKP